MGTYLLLALVAPALIAYCALVVAEERSLLRDWAQQNNFRLLHSKRRLLLTGPFFWRSRKSSIFHVHIRDAEGVHRTGLVRFGPRFAHFGDTKSIVEWQEDPKNENR